MSQLEGDPVVYQVLKEIVEQSDDDNSLITETLDIWLSAQIAKKSGGRGRSSSKAKQQYGIQKLRELILELAVRGKLVSQDANDEPASVLLEKIAVEKIRCIKENKIKKHNPLPDIAENKKLFELPQGWGWVRFGSIFTLEYGKNLPKGKRTNTGEYSVYGSNGVVGTHEYCSVKKPCVVVGRKGSAGALNLCVDLGCWVTDVAYSVVSSPHMDLEFTFKLFHTLGLDKLGKGIKPGLNRNEAHVLPVAIPPLAEQHRIVAKVAELMALCDQLEQQQDNQHKTHQNLVSTVLEAMTRPIAVDDVQSEQELQKAGMPKVPDRRDDSAEDIFFQNIDLLLTTEESIDQLKQTILQLAVMGKLVPQDPNDEPASVLLEKIATEKARLIKEKKIKKQKPRPETREDEKLFELPEGWAMTRMQDITKLITCGMASTPKYFDSGKIFLSAKNVKPYKFMPEDHKFVDEETFRKITQNAMPEKGDILLTRVGAGIGEAAIVNIDIEFAFYVSLTLIKPFLEYIDSNFLLHWLNSPEGVKKSIENIYGSGVSQGNLNVNQVRGFEVPVPPLAEQHRIVTKVDQLMILCDQLKVCIRQSQTQQQHLADAVVEQAVG